MRYMVQEYLLGGLTTQGSVKDWLGSQEATFMTEILSDGDFFEGTDKDLISTVYPVFNQPSDLIKNT